jgi:hypothetical protein
MAAIRNMTLRALRDSHSENAESLGEVTFAAPAFENILKK